MGFMGKKQPTVLQPLSFSSVCFFFPLHQVSSISFLRVLSKEEKAPKYQYFQLKCRLVMLVSGGARVKRSNRHFIKSLRRLGRISRNIDRGLRPVIGCRGTQSEQKCGRVGCEKLVWTEGQKQEESYACLDAVG